MMQSMKYDIFSNKSQQVKFNAFFQYLKSFSEAGLDTLQKLQSEFNREMRSKMKHSQTLTTIKSLLSSYEIFILEIKDSCDFVEIAEFGYCIGKTFLQLTKIIKWFLRAWLKDSRKYDKLKASLETEAKQDQEGEPSKNLCAFCEEVIKTSPYQKQTRGKRKGVAISDMGDLREAKKTHLNEMTHLMEFKEHVLERYTQKQIESKRYISGDTDIDILNRKHVAMKLQISNNESVLQEVLNEFNVKTEAMARFVSNTQASCIEDFRMNHDSDYSHFEEQMRVVIAEKYEEAKVKMKQLLRGRIAQFQRTKREGMVSREVQTMTIEPVEKDKGEARIKQMNSAIMKLKNQLESQKAMSESLRKLLESKSVEFEEEFLNYRREIITGQKSRHFLKSLKSFKEITEEESDKENSAEASIRLDDTSQQIKIIKKQTRKQIGGLKEKDRPKKRNSIKFTLQDTQIQQNVSFVTRKSNLSASPIPISYPTSPLNAAVSNPNSSTSNNNATIQTQTDPIPIQNLSLSSQTSYSKLLQPSIDSSSIPKTPIRNEKISSQRGCPKKCHSQLYSHIKSKLYDQREAISKPRKDFKQTRSSCMGNLVKKLSVDHLFQAKPQPQPPAKCFKIESEPLFTSLTLFSFSNQDLRNLFLNDKNAHNYECLIYRNSMFTCANLNPKRAMTFTTRVETADVDWNFRRDFIVSDSMEGKLVSAIFQQLNHLRRRSPNIYQQVRQILRSPLEVSKKMDVVQLQGGTPTKDIQHSELKKMVNLILRFHCECVGDRKDVICEHLVKFCSKIGIKFGEISQQ